MKKLFAGLLAVGMVLAQNVSYSESNVKLFLNGEYINSDGILCNDRTLIPLRAVCESLGSNVSWDGENRIVLIEVNGETVQFQIGNSCMTTPSGDITLDTAPIIENDRTYVPLRALFELFGCNVSWNNGSVNIQKPDSGNNGSTDIEIPGSENNDSTGQLPEQNGAQNGSLSQQVFDLVNSERAKNGLSALSYNSELESVAAAHSRDMAENNYFSHTSLAGLSPFDRMQNAGISYTRAAENIAAGQNTALAVMDSWMNSQGHRANILDPNLREIGIGVYEGGNYGIYWTQLFRTQ